MINRRSAAKTESSETPDLDPVLDFMRLLWHVEHGLQSTSKRMERRSALPVRSGWSFAS
jgi:hypothetical protein